MERRFRNLQSPKYLGSDKRFKAREQEGVSAQRKRQGFDVAVNPLFQELALILGYSCSRWTAMSLDGLYALWFIFITPRSPQ
jgi:hypothetical protein